MTKFINKMTQIANKYVKIHLITHVKNVLFKILWILKV